MATGDIPDAIKEKARQGDNDALLRWTHARANKSEAEKLIAAADSKSVDAWYKLGMAIGWSREKLFSPDMELENLWLAKAGDKNHPQALESLGDNAIEQRKYPEAARYLAAAAKAGSQIAGVKYAWCMILGLGVEKNVSGGFLRLARLAEEGHPLASAMARETLETGKVDMVFSPLLLGDDPNIYDKLKNSDGTCNIPDLEHRFTGARDSEKYLKHLPDGPNHLKLVTATAPSSEFTGRKTIIIAGAESGDIEALIEWTRNTPEYAAKRGAFDLLIAKLEDPKERDFMGFPCFHLGTEFPSQAEGDSAKLRVLWYKKSLDLGCAFAGGALGQIFSKQKDFQSALNFYRAGAKLGYGAARLTAALYLYFGLGSPRDPETAFRDLQAMSVSKFRDGLDVPGDARKVVEQRKIVTDYIVHAVGNANCRWMENDDGTIDLDKLEKLFAAV